MPDFSSKNLGQWFYFDPEDHEQGGICLRELSMDEVARIEKVTVKHRHKPIRGAMVDVPHEDTKTALRMTWDFCIVDWTNVLMDGQSMDCTPENKVKMMNCTDFAKFVSECISTLVEINRTLEEAKAKN